jgi:hypothetical protein
MQSVIALTGGAGWATIPLAFSRNTIALGEFVVSNPPAL